MHLQQQDQQEMDKEEIEKFTLSLIRDYHVKYSLADIQLDSYNYFVNHSLQKIIKDKSDIIIENKYKLSFKDVFLDYPMLIEEDRNIHRVFPIEARTRDINYEGTLSVNLVEIVEGVEKQHYKVPISKIPIMVNSCRCNLSKLNKLEKVRAGECENDPGGYFIINGKERVIIAQERINYNQIYIYSTQKHSHSSRFDFVAEIRSMSDETGHSTLIEGMIDNSSKLFFSIPFIKKEIPIAMIFVILDVGFDDYCEIVTRGINEKYKHRFMDILRLNDMSITKKEAVKYICQFSSHSNIENGNSYILQIVERELFPHVGISTQLYKIMLGNIIRRLLMTKFGLKRTDDRDNISNKRIESTGVLISELFRSLFKKFIKNLEVHLSRRMDALAKIPLCSPIITQGLNYVFSTGNWNTQHNSSYVRTGVSQIMTRLSYIGMVSYLRKTVIPVGKETKNSKIRQIHQSTFGFIDPVETPEGQFAGITRNFSFLVRITNGVPFSFVCDIIDKFKLMDCDLSQPDNVLVTVNGKPIGYLSDHVKFTERILELKRKKFLSRDVSIVFNASENNIYIYCDAGRLIRPVFSPDFMNFICKTNIDWNDLVEKGVISYIDTNEAENSVIGIDYNQKSDYYEIHPVNMLGVCSGSIVFSDHSQAPRNIYSTNMMKQAVGVYALNNDLRTDTITHLISYPQKQLVSTATSRYTRIRDMPSGVNAIVAIACYSG